METRWQYKRGNTSKKPMEEKLVKLRMTRMGRKKRPFYRIIAIDSRKRRDGMFIERIGHYDPYAKTEEAKYQINEFPSVLEFIPQSYFSTIFSE